MLEWKVSGPTISFFLMMTKLMELYMHGLKISFIEAPSNSCIAINIKIYSMKHINKILNKHKPICINIACIYKLSILLPLFVNSSTKE